MAKTQVGGLRTIGAREAAEAGVEPDLSVPEQLNQKFKHVFQSRKSAFVISLKRRRVHFMPDGSKEEEVPETKAGARLDMVRFTDHFFRTDDDEIAAAFEAQPSQVFGIDGLCWRYEDKQNEQRAARAAEIRKALAEDPSLAKEVALGPSDKKDWDEKPAVSRPAATPLSKLSDEELEKMTAPQPR